MNTIAFPVRGTALRLLPLLCALALGCTLELDRGVPAPSPAVVPEPASAEQPSTTTAQAVAVGESRPAPARGGCPDLAALAAQLMPAVVSIQVEQKLPEGHPRGMGMGPSDLFRFFGSEVPREYANRGLGSGFVIDASGLVLTNAHVVERASRIEVTFARADGSERRMSAHVLGHAPEYDVALLQVALEGSTQLVVAPLGDSDASRIGEWVLAIGNPFGLSHSVSLGIISAKQRRDIMPGGRDGLYDFLQTDASINPGNSGGPLIGTTGEVIGINAAINAQGQGIGFAIPINLVKQLLPQLRAGGRLARSWLGLGIQPLTEELAQSYGLKTLQGALVAEVRPEGPAAAAGLQAGDVVLAFAGKRLDGPRDLQLWASMAGTQKPVPISLWRDGKRLELTVVPAPMPSEDSRSGASAEPEAPPTTGALGLAVTDPSVGLQQRLGLAPHLRGALIQAVAPGSPAAQAGLQVHDLILAVDRTLTPDSSAFQAAVAATGKAPLLRLRILRGGSHLFVALRR